MNVGASVAGAQVNVNLSRQRVATGMFMSIKASDRPVESASSLKLTPNTIELWLIFHSPRHLEARSITNTQVFQLMHGSDCFRMIIPLNCGLRRADWTINRQQTRPGKHGTVLRWDSMWSLTGVKTDDGRTKALIKFAFQGKREEKLLLFIYTKLISEARPESSRRGGRKFTDQDKPFLSVVRAQNDNKRQPFLSHLARRPANRQWQANLYS